MSDQSDYFATLKELEAEFKRRQREIADQQRQKWKELEREAQREDRRRQDWLTDYYRAKEEQDVLRLVQLLKEKPDGITVPEVD